MKCTPSVANKAARNGNVAASAPVATNARAVFAFPRHERKIAAASTSAAANVGSTQSAEATPDSAMYVSGDTAWSHESVIGNTNVATTATSGSAVLRVTDLSSYTEEIYAQFSVQLPGTSGMWPSVHV
jgi:hypothetical protein